MDNYNVPAFHFVMHVLHRSRGPADHAFNWVSVPSTKSVAVERALASRVPMIEFVCSAAERISNDYCLLLEEPGQWDCSHDFLGSDAKDCADERGKDLCDADSRGSIGPAVLGQAADHDARILTAIAKSTP